MFEVLSPEVILVRPSGPGSAGRSLFPLKVRPGKAFPPTHATTRLCLELLAELASSLADLPVLDVGCGSGVLGLAAAAWGAPRVVSLDISAAATQATAENARINHLAHRVAVVQGSVAAIRGTFGLLLGNLPAGILQEMAPAFQRLAASGAHLICSGFREPEEPEILACLEDWGWIPARRRTRDFRHPELPPSFNFTWVAWHLLHRS